MKKGKAVPLSSLVAFLLVALPQLLHAANNLHESIAAMQTANAFQHVELFKSADAIDRQERNEMAIARISVESSGIQILKNERPETMRLLIPDPINGQHEALLVRSELLTSEFQTGTLNTSGKKRVTVDTGIHYRGILTDDPSSLVTLSMVGEEINGLIASEKGQFELVQDPDSKTNCLLYESKQLRGHPTFDCSTLEAPAQLRQSGSSGTESTGCKTVSVYFECDYQFYLDKGSNVQQLIAYVTSFFNQVAAIYRNENIDLLISGINIWTVPDPYTAMSSAAEVLPAFRTTRGSGYDGSLAHLLTSRNIGGGMSYLDVLCIKSYAHGVSYVHPQSNGTPTYSWTVGVVAHEIGHNFGSHHTQWCGWQTENGGTAALDNCFTTEGGCPNGPAPVNGGTIMSYCHLTNHGINFANGFGPVPGELMRNKLASSSCIAASGEIPEGLTSSDITTESAVISWSPVHPTSVYRVQLRAEGSSLWTNAGSTTSTNMVLTGLTAGRRYEFQVSTDCSVFSPTAYFQTITGIGCTAPYGLSASPGKNGEVNVSWNGSLPAGPFTVRYRTIGSSEWLQQDAIRVNHYTFIGLNSGTEYEFQVSNSCSPYSRSSRFITPFAGCPIPNGLTANSISRNSVSFNWSASSGALNYMIRYRKATSEQWTLIGPRSTTNLNLTGLTAGTTYEWKVKSNCSGYSVSQTFTTLEAAPMPVSNSTEEMLQLYPNPASSKFEVRFNTESAGTRPQAMTLSDMVGKTILTKTVIDPEVALEVDIRELPDGIYILQITDELGKNYKKRLIKR